MGWFLEALKKYAVFRGRSRRKEYWYFFLFSVIASILLSIVDVAIGTFSAVTGIGLLGGIFTLAILIPSIAVSVRRLHDIGRSGWWYLIALIPLIGTIALLIFAAIDSEPGGNRYGPNPKAMAA